MNWPDNEFELGADERANAINRAKAILRGPTWWEASAPPTPDNVVRELWRGHKDATLSREEVLALLSPQEQHQVRTGAMAVSRCFGVARKMELGNLYVQDIKHTGAAVVWLVRSPPRSNR